jgi:hypothetical protein
MRGLVAVMACLAGCDRLLGIDHVTGDAGISDVGDGGTDPDAADASIADTIVGSMYFQVTVLGGTPSQLYTATNTLIDTGAGCPNIYQPTGQQQVCLILASQIRITGKVYGRGPRPLVLAAAGDILIDDTGLLDVSSGTGAKGAGANESGCAMLNGADQLAAKSHAGGGPGGSFGTRGGTGGPGEGGVTAMSGGTATAMKLRGGCPGGNGGSGPSTPGPFGGDSGGAVYLMAGGSILIAGQIAANGVGGGGGTSTFSSEFIGGAGGGTGGLIALDAKDSIVMTGNSMLVAMGGGGGGGGDGLEAGKPGVAGSTMTGAGGMGAIGLGIASADHGGDGGAGSLAAAPWTPVPGNPGGATQGGGGGGGGGAGIIRVSAPMIDIKNDLPKAGV